MDPDELSDLTVLLPPLLRSLEALGLVARNFNPPDFGALMDACGTPDTPLRHALPRLDAWPPHLHDLRLALTAAGTQAIQAFDELRAAPDQADGLTAAFRALRHLPRAQEALYPLAANLPPVSRFFLDPAHRADPERLQRLAKAAPDTGVLHVDNDPGQRGGFSLYVPEDYDPAAPPPVVFALHGGSGHGRDFLWSWLREARTFGAIVAAPTSLGRTWAIQGEDADTPNLARILDIIRARWTIDSGRLLLSGMSDGGTFAYVSGLEPGSRFTHLAPTSAAFHPMLVQFADPDRLSGLPIRITHGVLDWMFDVAMARDAAEVLSAAGAAVSYRELDDLAHAYPRELNAEVLAWLGGGGGAPPNPS